MSQPTSHKSNRPLPPGSYGLPIIGETLEWRRNPLAFLRKRYERYGRIFKSSTYGHKEITMLGPEANKFIFLTHRDHFEWGGGQEIFFNRKLFGENLFLQDGEVHDRQRKLITPAFHGSALRAYFDIMRELAESYARRWAETGVISAYGELRKLTFEIAARLLLGSDTKKQTDYLSRLFETLSKGMQAFPRWNLPWMRFGRAMNAVKSLREYFTEVLHQRRSNPKHDALGMLIIAQDEDGSRLSDEEIVSQMIALVFAAHDTTTSSTTWLLYELDRHPDVQEKLLSELFACIGSGPLSPEHISQLRYCDYVLKEVERLHPAVTGAPRKVVKEFEFDGFRVPVGSIVYYSTLFTHMIPDIFVEPEVFDPDRFAPPRQEDQRTPFSLIGFGGGPRSCVGQGFARFEMKVLLAVMLEKYQWSVLPDQDFRASYTPTKCPKDGLLIQFRKEGD